MRPRRLTATLLPDGKVLVTHDGQVAPELYDPVSGRWTARRARATLPRRPVLSEQATLLADGRVLLLSLAGDAFYGGRALRPWQRHVGSDSSPPMGRGPATLLADGSVLVVGRDGSARYDPGTGTWVAVTSPPQPSYFQNGIVIRLLDGRVLAIEERHDRVVRPGGHPVMVVRATAMIGVLVVGMSGCGGSVPVASSGPPSNPPSTATSATQGSRASASASVAPSPSVGPSPSAAVAALPETDDHVYPGMYTPHFQPSLTFTVGSEVQLSCLPGFKCRGDIEVNQPGWLGLGFGNAPAFEVTIDRIDKVLEPHHKSTLINPPKDLAGWVSTLPGITLTAPAVRTRIGGFDAVQLDVRSGATAVTFGPIPGMAASSTFGFGPHDAHRIYGLEVDGHAVLIVVGVVGDTPDAVVTPDQLQPAIEALQPLVDSIVWQR